MPADSGKVQVIIKDMVYPKSYGTAIWVGLPAIGKHLKNIFEDGKLSQDMTVSKNGNNHSAKCYG